MGSRPSVCEVVRAGPRTRRMPRGLRERETRSESPYVVCYKFGFGFARGDGLLALKTQNGFVRGFQFEVVPIDAP